MTASSLRKHVAARDVKYLLWKVSPALLFAAYRASGRSASQAYSAMQKVVYEARARVDPKTFVVGMFEAHEQYDYETHLLRPFTDERLNVGSKAVHELIALDFACGPGRMIRRMAKRVGRCDGIDISAENIRAAQEYCAGVSPRPELYVNNGRDFASIGDDVYDLVFSTIALQHIPVHEIRQNIFAEMFRVMKSGASLSLQMAYGNTFDKVIEAARQAGYPAQFARWRENAYRARDTNGFHDVVITADTLGEVREDLQRIGFENVTHELADLPHASHYDNWIFLYARKPEGGGNDAPAMHG